MAGPVTGSPLKIVVVALWLVYTEKVWEIPESILLRFTVTVAPAGTEMVLRLKARFCAVRLTVMEPAVEAGEGLAVGAAGAEPVGEADGVGGKLAGLTTNQTPPIPLPLVSPGALSLIK